MKWLFIAAMVSVSFPDEPSEDSCEESSSMREKIEHEAMLSKIFITKNEVRAIFRRIDLKFVASEPGRDNWKEFIPILERVVKSQSSVSNRQEMLSIEFEILEWLTVYAFACEYDFDEIKANFDSRLACLDLECQLEYVRSDTNAVMMIADWLGGAQSIVVDEEAERQRVIEQAEKDRKMLYGEKFRPWRGAVSTSYMGGPLHSPYCWSPYLIRELKAQQFRRRYNERLPDFRRKAEARMRKFVFEEFKAKDQAEREALWAEFCRRAKFAAKH
ncbi:MAG: hypothetical protein IKJ45_17405 [Kiritimatiellae bacterium]|nr:hypothetical protein [Kiritimatiellia bacterium]MBR3924899.1 hypothetical protein [Kiritimatiellia bacterium]